MPKCGGRPSGQTQVINRARGPRVATTSGNHRVQSRACYVGRGLTEAVTLLELVAAPAHNTAAGGDRSRPRALRVDTSEPH